MSARVNQNYMFDFHDTTPEQVFKVIKALSNKKSAGWDEIPLYLIKEVADFIAEPLSIIISQSFQRNFFPKLLKYAELKPIFKKGERSDADNYRPVSVLPSFSKVFQKVAFNQIINYLDHNFTQFTIYVHKFCLVTTIIYHL